MLRHRVMLLLFNNNQQHHGKVRTQRTLTLSAKNFPAFISSAFIIGPFDEENRLYSLPLTLAFHRWSSERKKEKKPRGIYSIDEECYKNLVENDRKVWVYFLTLIKLIIQAHFISVYLLTAATSSAVLYPVCCRVSYTRTVTAFQNWTASALNQILASSNHKELHQC